METFTLNIENEFKNIYSRFEHHLTERCMDLHSIQLSVTNFTELKEIKFPSPFITYFLKPTGQAHNYFASYTKHNVDSILVRTNNFFAMNILNLAEWHLKEALTLLKSLLAQQSISFLSKSFNEKYNIEFKRKKTFGALHVDIKDTVNKVSTEIIPEETPYYGYLKNYIILRNCLAHKAGKITEAEIEMEIRLPFISEQQVLDAAKDISSGPLAPQTVVRKWQLNDNISLHINEVEGIAYGLTKVLFEIFRHMYKAADLHVAHLERIEKNKQV